MIAYQYNSEDEAEEGEVEPVIRGRRNIRNIKKFNQLSSLTRAAFLEETNRKLRIANHEKELLKLFPNSEAESRLVLDFDPKTKKPTVSVHPRLVNLLEKHQKEGIKFMFNACIESVEQVTHHVGSGCILAHCMGLGKTLQVVTLAHTLLHTSNLNIRKILILCPKNTVLNWVNEFHKWIQPPLQSVKVYNPSRSDSARIDDFLAWQRTGGVCVYNYTAFRLLIEKARRTKRKDILDALIDPGPDLVVCDEGHVLKNENTRLAQEMLSIKTLRRIILTGTPLQNNLIEYFCMVNFVRPNLLGTKAEFKNMFEYPIQNGQYDDSNDDDVALMKGRAHVLHRTLTTCIQRYDHTTLAEFLPKKYEFVLNLSLTESQIDLYLHYLGKTALDSWRKLIKMLFADYQLLQRVWTHPYSLLIYDQRPSPPMPEKFGELDSDDEEVVVRPSRWTPGWWTDFVEPEDLRKVESSAKVVILFEIIKQCIQNGEKLLIFSGSLISLEMIEFFLNDTWDDGSPGWECGLDYFLLTGATSGPDRDEMCQKFNDPKNLRTKAFLISTRAGGLGITLNAANRAVIFDASWNPSHDIQSIFRIYRLGQTKPCFVYRLISSGSMEEKIYERQVAKQSISRRVVDEKQIHRHYTMDELTELYHLETDKVYNNNPAIASQDALLAKLVFKFPNLIKGYHEHDSLLKHKISEELRDYEKNEAWLEFSDGTNELIEGDRFVASMISAENFNISNFKIVFRQKYPHIPEASIGVMVDELTPRIQELFKRPNFKDLMFEQAMKLRKAAELANNQKASSSSGRGKRKGGRSVPQPIKSWGKYSGREFGDPDTSSESD